MIVEEPETQAWSEAQYHSQVRKPLPLSGPSTFSAFTVASTAGEHSPVCDVTTPRKTLHCPCFRWIRFWPGHI